MAPHLRRSLPWAGPALAALLALVAATAAGFDRDVVFDLGPFGHDDSVALFVEGVHDIEVNPGEPGAVIPYILPGPLDRWAGSREHTLSLRLDALPRPTILRLHAIETHDVMPPHLTLRLNGRPIGAVETRPGTGYPPQHQTRGVRAQYAVRLPAGPAGPSVLAITNDGGSWVMWERIGLREAHSTFAWGYLGLPGRPPQAVLGLLVASLGSLLLGSVVGRPGRHRGRMLAAAGALVLMTLAWARGAADGVLLSALPRWAWLLVPWMILAATAEPLGAAARAADRWARSGWSRWRLGQRLADGRPRSRRRALAVAGAAFLLAFFVQALYVKAFGVEIPFLDEWEHLRMLVWYRSGTLTWPELFVQHNEHRILVPRLLFLAAFALLGEWSPRANMLLCAALVGGIAFVWSYALQRLGVRTWVALVSTAVLVSPLQMENIAWGFQSAIYLAVLGSLLAVSAVALAPGVGWGTLVTAMAGCAIASFSFGAGLASWIAVALCLGLRTWLAGARLPMPRRRWSDWTKIGVFALAAGLCVVAFFHGFQSSRVAPIHLDLGILHWTLAALAYPFVETLNVSMLALLAAVLLQWAPIVGLVTLYARRRDEDPAVGKLCMLVGMASVVVISAGAISVGRSWVQIVSPRYGTVFLWTTLVALLAVAELLGVARRWAAPRYAGAAATVLLWLVAAALLSPYVVRHRDAVASLEFARAQREEMLQAMVRYLDPASSSRRLGDPLAYPVREALEDWLTRPAELAVLPMELRLAHASGWRVTETEAGGAVRSRRWVHRPRVESAAIRVDRPVLAVAVAGYPSAPGNWLAIEPVSDPGARIVYRGPNPGASWTPWWVDARAWRGQAIRLVGVVGNGDGADWLEFKPPGQARRLVGLVRDFPTTLELVAGALAVALLGLASARVDDAAGGTAFRSTAAASARAASGPSSSPAVALGAAGSPPHRGETIAGSSDPPRI